MRKRATTDPAKPTLRKWERQLLEGKGREAALQAQDSAFYEWALAKDRLEGWKAIAAFVGLSERNLREAVKAIPGLEACIYRDGGRYWAVPGELLNWQAELLDRRGGGEKRVQAAAKQKRKGGRFSGKRKAH